MKTLILVLIVFTSSINLATSQENSKTEDNTTKIMIEYARFMREEAKAHRVYLEDLYTKGATIAGVLIAILGGIITWLNWKTKDDFKKQLKATMESYSGPLIEESIKNFKNQIGELQEKFQNDINDRHLVLEQQVDIFQKNLSELKNQLRSNINSMVDLLKREQERIDVSDLTEFKAEQYKILWVDDHPENNLVPIRMMENVGIIVHKVQSTDEALKEIKQDDYSLVISDMGRDHNSHAGLDLLEKLNEINFKIPVIIYSSIAAIERYGQQAKDLGAVSSIYGISPLIEKVYEVLSLDPIRSKKA